MTEKRFIEIISLMTVKDNQTGKKYKCEMGIDEELLDLLNTLHEEKEALELDNKLLLEEMKEIRDKLTVYLKVKGIE